MNNSSTRRYEPIFQSYHLYESHALIPVFFLVDDEGFDRLRGLVGRRRFRGRTTTSATATMLPAQCVTCAADPCYPGVVCTPTPTGYTCGSCPSSMTGDGEECVQLITCVDDPCFPRVQCTDTG